MRGRALLVVATSALSAACSLFLDSAEFAGGDAATDAGADASFADVAVGDAPGDALGNDAGVFAPCPDGGFCDDFERSDSVQAAWSVAPQTGACKLLLDPTIAEHGKTSLQNVIPEATTNDACVAHMDRALNEATAGRKVTISVALRISAIPGRDINVFGLLTDSPDRAHFFMLTNDGLYLVEQEFSPNPFSMGYPVGAITPGTFHRVLLEHDVATRKSTVFIDGEKRLDITLQRNLSASSFAVQLGNTFAKAGPALDVWFDDFRVWVEP